MTEARDPNGVFFDPTSALTASLPPDPGAVLDTMLTALTRHTERLEDDAAALALTHVPANGQGETSAGPSDERPGRILGGG
nr:hypothetical protein [Streptomyces xiaopingdaonensis]